MEEVLLFGGKTENNLVKPWLIKEFFIILTHKTEIVWIIYI